jgi:4-amino-4-deoxy-L-arabinose transferase-like glycosyltransferase
MSLFKNTHRMWQAGILGVCLLAAAMFYTAVTQTRIDHPIRGDARDYFAYAYNLDTYGIYSRTWPEAGTKAPTPDAMRVPVYPAMVSLFLDKDDIDASLARVLNFQALLGMLTVLVYLLLYRRIMPPLWALGAGLLTAISPHLINASVYLLTETLFTFLLGLHLLTLEKALRLTHARWALAAGILLALSFLTRPTTQYLLLAYLLVLFVWARSNWRVYAKCLLWLILPVAIVASAWTTRNLIETGRSSDPALAASFLHHGMYINMMYEDHVETYGYPYRYDPLTSEIGGNPTKVMHAIAQKFQEEPQRYLSWYLIGKPIQFFAWNLTESVGDAFVYAPLKTPYMDNAFFQGTHLVAQLLHPFLILLSLIGACLGLRQNNIAAALLSIVLLYFVAMHMIGAPFPRYSIPLRPINDGLALYALYLAVEWIKTRLEKSR